MPTWSPCRPGAKEIGRQIKTVWMRPGTRLGFFSHMGTQFSITTFALLWGVPYLKSAQGLDSTTVGSLLTLSVISAIVAGPILGILTGPLSHASIVVGSHHHGGQRAHVDDRAFA